MWNGPLEINGRRGPPCVEVVGMQNMGLLRQAETTSKISYFVLDFGIKNNFRVQVGFHMASYRMFASDGNGESSWRWF